MKFNSVLSLQKLIILIISNNIFYPKYIYILFMNILQKIYNYMEQITEDYKWINLLVNTENQYQRLFLKLDD